MVGRRRQSEGGCSRGSDEALRRQSASVRRRRSDTGASGHRSLHSAVLPIDASLATWLQRRVSELVRIEVSEEAPLQDLAAQESAAPVTEASKFSEAAEEEVHSAAVCSRVAQAAEGVQRMCCKHAEASDDGLESSGTPSHVDEIQDEVHICDTQSEIARAPAEKVDVLVHQSGIMVQQLNGLSEAIDELKAFQLPVAIQEVLNSLALKVSCFGRLFELATSDLADLENLSQLWCSHSDSMGQLLEHIQQMQRCLQEQASKLDPATRSSMRWLPAVEHCLVSLGILSTTVTTFTEQLDLEASSESCAVSNPMLTLPPRRGSSKVCSALTLIGRSSDKHQMASDGDKSGNNLTCDPGVVQPPCHHEEKGGSVYSVETESDTFVYSVETESDTQNKTEDIPMSAASKREETSAWSSDCSSMVMCCSDAPPLQQQAEKHVAIEAIQDTNQGGFGDSSLSTSPCIGDLGEELDTSETCTSVFETPATHASGGIPASADQDESLASGNSAGAQSLQLAGATTPTERGTGIVLHGGGTLGTHILSPLSDFKTRQSKEFACRKSAPQYSAAHAVMSSAAGVSKDEDEKPKRTENSSHWPLVVDKPCLQIASEALVRKARSEPLTKPSGQRPKYCRPSAQYTLETLSPMQEKLRTAILEDDSSPHQLMQLLSEGYAAEQLPHIPDGNFKHFKQKPSKTKSAYCPTQRGISLPALAGQRRFGGSMKNSL